MARLATATLETARDLMGAVKVALREGESLEDCAQALADGVGLIRTSRGQATPGPWPR